MREPVKKATRVWTDYDLGVFNCYGLSRRQHFPEWPRIFGFVWDGVKVNGEAIYPSIAINPESREVALMPVGEPGRTSYSFVLYVIWLSVRLLSSPGTPAALVGRTHHQPLCVTVV